MKNSQHELAKLKYEINSALKLAREKGRDYTIREISPDQEEYVLHNYPAEVWKQKVDRRSFHKYFDPKKCHSKIVNKIYGMNGRYVKIKLSNQELAACKKYGLKVVSTIYKIYKPRAHCNK